MIIASSRRRRSRHGSNLVYKQTSTVHFSSIVGIVVVVVVVNIQNGPGRFGSHQTRNLRIRSESKWLPTEKVSHIVMQWDNDDNKNRNTEKKATKNKKRVGERAN